MLAKNTVDLSKATLDPGSYTVNFAPAIQDSGTVTPGLTLIFLGRPPNSLGVSPKKSKLILGSDIEDWCLGFLILAVLNRDYNRRVR